MTTSRLPTHNTIGTLSSELLLAVAAARLRVVCPELATRLDLSTPDALISAKAAITALDAEDPADGAVAVTVVGSIRLPEWVRETCRFVLSVPAERAEPWRRSFTRTVYLAGQPRNLIDRFTFDHVAEDGSVAWAGPAPGEATATLRRLLKTFSGARDLPAWPPVTVDVPAPPGQGHGTRLRSVHRDLYIATARTTVSTLLVQVNHLLAEAVMDGLIAYGDQLTLRSVPHLTGLAIPFTALRVDADAQRPRELRAYAALTEET